MYSTCIVIQSIHMYSACCLLSGFSFSGADQEHKTDEMHTALMEACMDGHVEVARLLLDHGAQVSHWLIDILSASMHAGQHGGVSLSLSGLVT